MWLPLLFCNYVLTLCRMHYEASKVEMVLVEPTNLKKFVEFFRSASPDVIHELHKPLLDMMFKSELLSAGLSQSETYITATLSKLQSVKEAIVIKSLLSSHTSF